MPGSMRALQDAYSFLVALLMRDLWMWGMTPPPAMVACTVNWTPQTCIDTHVVKCIAMHCLFICMQLAAEEQGKKRSNEKTAALACMWLQGLHGCSYLNEGVELLVSANGQLKMARCDTLHLQILGGVSSQLQHLSGQVFCGW